LVPPLVNFGAFIGDWLLPHNQFRSGHKAARHGLGVPSSMGLRVAEVIEEEGRFLPVALSDVRFRG
jgi:hypothetical protein